MASAIDARSNPKCSKKKFLQVGGFTVKAGRDLTSTDRTLKARPAEHRRSRLPRNRRTVNHAYGGVLSGSAVRERIIGAFLVEEQKIVKSVLKNQKAKEKLASKN